MLTSLLNLLLSINILIVKNLSIYLYSIHLSINLSICQSVNQSINHQSVSQYINLSTYRSIYLFVQVHLPSKIWECKPLFCWKALLVIYWAALVPLSRSAPALPAESRAPFAARASPCPSPWCRCGWRRLRWQSEWPHRQLIWAAPALPHLRRRP